MIPVVKRNVDSLLRSRVQQPFAHRVLAHRANKIAVANAIDRFLPALSEVARPENVRAQIVEIVSIHRRISRRSLEGRRFDNAARAPLRYAGGSYFLPSRSPVLRYLDVPVIRSNPNQAF